MNDGMDIVVMRTMKNIDRGSNINDKLILKELGTSAFQLIYLLPQDFLLLVDDGLLIPL